MTALDDPANAELATEELLLAADAAREDPAAFFELVLQNEHTRAPIRIAPHQRVMLDFVLTHPRCVVKLPFDHSKCHGAGTPILMADGSAKAVEHVRAGDRVAAPGGPKVVLSASSGRGELYRVVPKKGSDPFVVNADHILSLVSTDTGKTVDISVREYLAKAPWFRSQHKLFRAAVPRFDGEQSVAVDPYFLGLWFGDGLHSVKNGVKLTNIDPEVRAYCFELAHAHGLHIVPMDHQTFALSWPGGRAGARKRANPLMRLIRQEVGGDALSMRRMRTAPWADRQAFLAGFIDADGGTRDNCVYISQKRAEWAEDVLFIARSLGIGGTRGSYEHPKYGKYASLCLFGEALANLPIRVPRKRVSADRRVRSALRTGFRLEPLGEGAYFGFTLGGDGRYLLGDFTVTHNTFTTGGLALWLLGRDPTMRGVIVSSTQDQASKPLRMVRDYIEQSRALQLVFPGLRKSPNLHDNWGQHSVTIARPYGIRDASMRAVGEQGDIQGSRLDWIMVDDLLREENVGTPELRAKTYGWFKRSVLSRLDPSERARVIVTNTTWHPDDLVHVLDRQEHWPSLTMRIDGTILLTHTDWDSPHLRPSGDVAAILCEGCGKHSDPDDGGARLAAHGPDPARAQTLWPERYSPARVEELRRTHLPAHFNQMYMSTCRHDASAMCRQEYVDRCMQVARDLGVTRMVPRYEGPNPTYTGIDLAFRQEDKADETAFFTFEARPDGVRVILDVDHGRWDLQTQVRKMFEKHERYKSILMIENVGAQDIVRQAALAVDKALPVYPYTTNHDSKAHHEHGLPAIFVEMSNGAWAIPNAGRVVEGPVRAWMDQCLYYAPTKHAGDILMAQLFAWAIAKQLGALRKREPDGGRLRPPLGASILAR